MPVSVKTMRDIWLDYLRIKEESLAEINDIFKDYLEKKKYSCQIFDFIERDLGEAGFSKIL